MAELDQIKQFSQLNHEPQWLTAKRMVAYQMASTLPKFHLKGVDTKHVAFNNPSLMYHPLDKHNYAPDDAKKKGVLAINLLYATRYDRELLQENLMEKCFIWNHDQFSAQHVAFLQTGAFVFIPSNVVVKEPIDVSKLVNPMKQEKHVLIIAGANSEATVVYSSGRHTSPNTRQITEILLGDNAHLNYYDSATTDAQQNQKGLYAYLARTSRLDSYVSLLNQHDTVYQGKVNLDGEGSEAYLNLISLSDHHQYQAIHNDVTNYQTHTTGIIRQRGIVANQATTHCYTVGKIVQGAKKTNSDQSARLLTLDPHSKGEIDPVLLIRDNDVEAGHSASIGKVNRELLYYLETRGISKVKAIYLLTLGFLFPLIQKFPEKNLRDKIFHQLEDRVYER
ncbi:SufD family Fe-S cluster assembly protein [Acetilactobacillus jinshanensis]|nr:SufD family Fe-S cluster assembly protein [Acetilactobacillus jinshanensis]URL60967.1 SufD family Fe-S cluster assembly protein [uncultured bacterium]